MTAAAPGADRLPVLLSPGPASGAGTFGGRFAAPVTYLVFGLIDILVFGLHAKGDVTFSFTPQFAKVTVPNLTLAAAATCYFCGAVTLALAAARLLDVLGVFRLGRVPRRVVIGAVLFLFVIALLAWAGGGQPIPVGVVNLLSGSLNLSIPIMLGALTAVICSTSGVINIAIEGQLLLGAFCAAIATSVTGSLWLGLICGAAAGSLVAALLAAFAIAYRVDQIVLGVVLNTLVLGLTGYLYNAIMVPYGDTLNNPNTFNPVKIPLLGDIPILGPVFFDASVFLYITYVLLIAIQVGLARTRWGLRTRAVGEHPVAADTVGIRVLAHAVQERHHRRAHRGHRRRVLHHRLGRLVRPGHVIRRGLHRARRDDLRPVHPVRRHRRRAAVRLHHPAAVDPVEHQRADPVQPAAAHPVRGDDHRGGRPGRQGPRPARRGRAVR